MKTPRENLLNSRKIRILNQGQYEEVIRKLAESEEEHLCALFGASGENLEIMYVEMLPDDCYDYRKSDIVGLRYEEFREYSGRRAGELSMESLGTAHLHKGFSSASSEDIVNLPLLGPELVHLIHHISSPEPCQAKVYATEGPVFQLNGRCIVPPLKEFDVELRYREK